MSSWHALWRTIHLSGDLSTQPHEWPVFINKHQKRPWQWRLAVEVGGTDNLHLFHFDAVYYSVYNTVRPLQQSKLSTRQNN
jgi:hypothetical protein